jgi:hypothetical protein
MSEPQYIYRTLLPLAGVATVLPVLRLLMLNGAGATVEWRSHVSVPAQITPMADQPEVSTDQCCYKVVLTLLLNKMIDFFEGLAGIEGNSPSVRPQDKECGRPWVVCLPRLLTAMN